MFGAVVDDCERSIEPYLREHYTDPKVCIVIGIVDEKGSRVYCVGHLNNGTGDAANADTVFEIGSITKTFTALLLEDLVARKQMELNAPVSRFLPKTVRMPSYNGQQITLLHLATHTSGLPCDPRLWNSPNNEYEKYSAEELHDFLSHLSLAREPGAECEYSNVGMALLGHAVGLTAGKDYESLVIERICRPLGMNSTCVTLPPDLKRRLATGHTASGKPTPNWEFDVYEGAGALRSAANDLLKYLSAHLGLTNSALAPLLERTHVVYRQSAPRLGNVSLAWMDRRLSRQTGGDLRGHSGGSGGYDTFIGFDKTRRRGVVVLCNQLEALQAEPIGWLLLARVPLSAKTAGYLAADSARVGVGIALDFDETKQSIRIADVRPGSPAFEAGLVPGMLVRMIDDTSTANKCVLECDVLLHGAAGTDVRFKVVGTNRAKPRTVRLTRRSL